MTTTIEDLMSHYFILKGTEDLPATYWKDRHGSPEEEFKKDLLAALQSVKPEKKAVDWQNISTPELIAKQSDRSGYNEGVEAYSQAISKLFGVK